MVVVNPINISGVSPISSTINLTYNFDNVIKNAYVAPNTAPNSADLAKMNKLTNYNLDSPHVSISISSQTPDSQQISLFDNTINTTVKYKLNFLRVCISPMYAGTGVISNINTGGVASYDKLFAIVLECTSIDSNQSTLLIIIPLSNTTDITETNLDNLINFVGNTTTTNVIFDINKFIPPTIFNTYNINNGKIIYTSPLKCDVLTILKYSLFVTDTTVTSQTENIPTYTCYSSSSVPSKQTFLTQNDIYIDCYKVSESSNIVGGIINTSALPSKRSIKKKKKNKKKTAAIIIVISTFLDLSYFFIQLCV